MPAHLMSGLALVLSVSAPPADPNDEGAGTGYELRIDSRLDMTVGGRTTAVTADSVIRYTWRAGGRKRALALDAVDLAVREDGKMLMSMAMSAEGVDDRTDPAKRVKAADAPPALRQILNDSFGPPVCTLTVDRDGRETTRSLTDRPGAKLILDNGMVANATLFHPPFPAGGAKPWTATRAVGMGGGGEATGELTYTPQPGGKDVETVVKVTGTLAKDRQPVGGGRGTRSSRYVVNGTQTYSAAKGGWASGKLVMEVALDVEVDGEPAGSGKGTMTATMKAR